MLSGLNCVTELLNNLRNIWKSSTGDFHGFQRRDSPYLVLIFTLGGLYWSLQVKKLKSNTLIEVNHNQKSEPQPEARNTLEVSEVKFADSQISEIIIKGRLRTGFQLIGEGNLAEFVIDGDPARNILKVALPPQGKINYGQAQTKPSGVQEIVYRNEFVSEVVKQLYGGMATELHLRYLPEHPDYERVRSIFTDQVVDSSLLLVPNTITSLELK